MPPSLPFATRLAQTGQPGTIQPESVSGGENKQDTSRLLVDIFESGGANAAARAVEEERNAPERQARLGELEQTERKVMAILHSARDFKLEGPQNKFMRGVELVFNPYAKQQRKIAEQRVKQQMLDAALGALPSLIQERRLLEQPGPFETKLQEATAEQFKEALDRARRQARVNEMRAAGVTIDPLQEAAYVESNSASAFTTNKPPTTVERLAKAADLGAMLTPDDAKKLDLGSKEENDAAVFAAEKAKEEADNKAKGKDDEPDFAPGYKTVKDAATRLYEIADQIQKQGPQAVKILGEVDRQTPFGVQKDPVHRLEPKISVDESIRMAAEKLGMTHLLPRMGLGQYAPGGAMNNPATDRKKIADKVRAALEKRRAAAAAKPTAGAN